MSAGKLYRIERSHGLPSEESIPAAPHSDQLAQIVGMLQELRSFMDPSQRLATDVIAAYRREIQEVYQLRAELDAMKEAITSTKNEIVSLHRSENEGKGMRRVAGELDAVVGATEEATTNILAGIEEIENQANLMRALGVSGEVNECLGSILDRVVGMYEACNFQDLTGQRISKIVGVLKFVEERLDRMIEVWGGLDAFKDLAESAPANPDDESSLLNGPRLAEDEGHVGQDDIDALFN
jgi:chemotaxis protein CheZ